MQRADELFERLIKLPCHMESQTFAGFFGWMISKMTEEDLNYLEKLIVTSENIIKESKWSANIVDKLKKMLKQ